MTVSAKPSFVFEALSSHGAAQVESDFAKELETYQHTISLQLGELEKSDPRRATLLEVFRKALDYNHVLEYFKSAVEEPIEGESKTQLYACLSSDNTVEGIFSFHIEEKNLFVETILSKPKNVFGASAVKGVGTACFEKIMACAKECGVIKVSLSPTPVSKPFYEKMGMVYDEAENKFHIEA
jgi:hypothetical protein